MFLGLIIGVVSGAAQFLMLSRFTKAVTAGRLDKIAVLFGLCQFFLPLAVLIGCAFLLNASLIWPALGMVVILVGFSLARLIAPHS